MSGSDGERFSGVLAPVITPFYEDLRVDPDRFVRHCQWLLEQGVDLAVFGTTSEANSLSLAEKRALLDGLLAAGISGEQLMPGTGACSLMEATELTRHAVAGGCRGVLMLPPFYYKAVSDDGLFRFYSEVIQHGGSDDLAIYLYNFPQMSQTPLSVELIDRLVKEYPTVVAGIKDSSADWDYLQALLVGAGSQWDDFRVFCGSETLLLKTLQGGGAGCISATANANPAAIRRLCDSWQADDAAQQQEGLNTIRQIFESFPIIPALKAATAQQSRDQSWLPLRPPLQPLTPTQQKSLSQALSQAHFQMPGGYSLDLGESRAVSKK